MCFVMSALFHRRIYNYFSLLSDRLVILQRYNSARTLKTVARRCHVNAHRPPPLLWSLGHHESASSCLVYSNCKVCRHLSDNSRSTGRVETAADGRWSNRCSCCGLNSKGAQELATYLTDELKLEKQSSCSQLPKLHGFQLVNTTGPSVVLTRKYYNEIVRIRFSVIHSLYEDVFAQFENTEGGMEDTDDDAPPQLVSRPSFDVELDRDTGKLLVIRCVFNPPTDLPMSLDDTLQDTFYIAGVAMVSKNQQQHTYNNTYFMSRASLSQGLTRQLLSMLSRRGIGPEFAHQLVELSTAYEHCCYVDFLTQLRDFMRSVPVIT